MAQRILLLEDVENVGRKGDIASVKPGYATNYLIPKGFALVANKAAMRRQSRLQEERKQRAEVERVQALELANRLTGETIDLEVKIDHEGHLYGSVSVLDIIDHIKTKTGIELEKKMVQLKHPIKELGVFDIPLRLKEGVMSQIRVKVAAQAPS